MFANLECTNIYLQHTGTREEHEKGETTNFKILYTGTTNVTF